jgi:hypothetical protein
MPNTSTDDYRDRARKRAAARQTGAWYKLQQRPDNCFRILPTPKSKTSPAAFLEYCIHRDVGPKKMTVRCGKDPVTGEGDCWLCDEQIPKLSNKGHEARAVVLAPQTIFLVQIAKVEDNDGEPQFSGPYLFTPSKRVADQILTSIIGNKKRDYLDAKKGYNITLSRTGGGKNDTVYGMLEPDGEPTAVPAKIVEKLKPFSALKEIPPYSEDKQKAAYFNQDIVEDEPEDEEEEETPKKKTTKAKAKPVEEEEAEEEDEETDEEDEEEESDSEETESEDDEDEEEEDEDEETPPAKKSKAKTKPEPTPKKKKSAPVEEDEEEDEPDDIDLDDDEDEEEDDEPPAKAKAKSKGKSKPAPVEEEEEDEEEESDNEDDEEEDDDTPEMPPAKSKKSAAPVKKAKK